MKTSFHANSTEVEQEQKALEQADNTEDEIGSSLQNAIESRLLFSATAEDNQEYYLS